ncbi:hypothetical protein D9758_009668 [Tetrapyrgos nigripes]|uniref:Uncharacterized protein n=1 Tax=Tetrapyrgos nigripes TaxID=182062 RepID=A0A8H5FQA2_9AGAR|nr:hypothetical protein D9758_009668 [Tetrapyrgos nigripes]
MSGLKNLTFGNGNPFLKYTGKWMNGTWNTSNGENGTLHATNDLTARVTFTFPVPANGFYYYGMKRSNGGRYGICIDDPICDPASPIVIDALDRSDDGHNPPTLLFFHKFNDSAVHNITLMNLEDWRGRPFGHSQLVVDKFEIQVPTTNLSASTSSSTLLSVSKTPGTSVQSTLSALYTPPPQPPPSQSAPATTSSAPPSFTNDASPTGGIVGGIIGALAAVLVFMFLFIRKRNIRRHKRNVESSLRTYSTGLNLSTHHTSGSHEVSSSNSRQPASGPSRSQQGYEFGYGVGMGITDMNKWDRKSVSGPVARGGSSTSKQPPSQPRRGVDAGRVLDPGDIGTLPPEYRQVFDLQPVRREEV